MVQCNKCDDTTEYELYQDNMEHWQIGTQIDVNIYRPHVCIKKDNSPKKYWCIRCGDGGAAIPFANPCIHRRQKINPDIKVGYF